jgi:hypothetical protein
MDSVSVFRYKPTQLGSIDNLVPISELSQLNRFLPEDWDRSQSPKRRVLSKKHDDG